jgi:uncharacterized membrane protein
MTVHAEDLRGAAQAQGVRADRFATTERRSLSGVLALATPAIFWAVTVLYAVTFTLISLRQYDAYLSHALDLGNMAQTFWNTVHGHPFHFLNMRSPLGVEAFGTQTRLSFHVEPIIPFLAVVYAFWQHVQTLLVMQTLAVASGAIPVRLFARRHLGAGLPEVAFPIAYLLFPALEAANLYEFHPVTFAAPLLLWAFYFADERRYSLFALFAVATMGCKEELGILVALMGLWIAIRNGDRQFGLIVAVLGVAWSATALFVIVPHFQAGKPSSYWGRYLPPGWPDIRYPVDQSQVRHFWLQHPGYVWDNLTSEAKRSYLQRILCPVGYLSLLSPLTFLAGVPTLLLNMLSYEEHMYSGLAQYNAELVPVMLIAAILGTEWLSYTVAPRLRIPTTWAVTACCLYVLFASVTNHRVNGFSPLAQGFSYPQITAHDRLLDEAIAMIPPDASVSAQDLTNPHLSDRSNIYLFPDYDIGKSDYIILDATQTTGSTLRPCDLAGLVKGVPCRAAAGPAPVQPMTIDSPSTPVLLWHRRWTVVFAQDGILLLKHYLAGEPLNTTLPPAFFTFAHPRPGDVAPHKLIARFGNYLELEGYDIQRREIPNERTPDVVLTTWWKVLKTPPKNTKIIHYLSDPHGYLRIFSDDQQTTDWFPLDTWKPGQTYKVQSYPLTVTTETSGLIGVNVGVTSDDIHYQVTSNNLPVTVISGPPNALAVGKDKGGTINRVLRVGFIWAQL